MRRACVRNSSLLPLLEICAILVLPSGRSSVRLERAVWDREAGGSSPPAPTWPYSGAQKTFQNVFCAPELFFPLYFGAQKLAAYLRCFRHAFAVKFCAMCPFV